MQKLYNETSVENIAEAIRDRRGLEGYNLYNGYFEWIDYIISSGGEKTYAKNYNTTYEIPIKSPFTISFNKEKIKTEDPYIRIAQYSNDTFVRRYDINGANIDKYTCNDETITKIRISGAKDLLVDDINIIVNEGIEVKPYEPYCRYKISEMAQGVNDLADDLQNYIPKATTEEKQFKAIPLAMSQKINGNVEQNGEATPDNPQEVKTMKCVNRLDLRDVDLTYAGVKYTYNGKRLVLNGRKYGANTCTIKQLTDVLKSNTNYSMSVKVVNGEVSIWNSNLYLKNGSVNLANFNIKGKDILYSTNFSFIEDNGISLQLTHWQDNIDFENAEFEIQITEGTSPQPYTPYGYLREDFVGKNKWKPFEKSSAGVTLKYSNGKYQLTGTNQYSGATNLSIGVQDISYWNLKAGKQYTLMIRGIQDTSNVSVAFLTYTATTQNFYTEKSNGSVSFIIPENTTRFYPIIQVKTAKEYDEEFEIMLAEETDDTYEPYIEPKSSLIYIGDNELLTDDFVEVDEKGLTKIEKKYYKIIFDGSDDEGWSYQNSKFIYNIPDIKLDTEYQIKVLVLSNYYKGISTRYRDEIGNNCISKIIGSNFQIGINDTRFTTVSEWKQWLQQHPVTVYYQLAEPQEIDLGKHDKIVPLEGTNNINILATLEPSKITTTHYYDYRNP